MANFSGNGEATKSMEQIARIFSGGKRKKAIEECYVLAEKTRSAYRNDRTENNGRHARDNLIKFAAALVAADHFATGRARVRLRK